MSTSAPSIDVATASQSPHKGDSQKCPWTTCREAIGRWRSASLTCTGCRLSGAAPWPALPAASLRSSSAPLCRSAHACSTCRCSHASLCDVHTGRVCHIFSRQAVSNPNGISPRVGHVLLEKSGLSHTKSSSGTGLVVDRGLMLGATRSSVLVSEHEVPQLLFLSMEKLVAINASRLSRGSSTSICSSARAPSLGWGLVQSLLARLNSSRVSPFARPQARASDTSIGTGSGGAPGSCSVQAACPAGRQGHGLDTGHKAWELPASTTLDAAAWRLQGAAAA